MEPSDKSSSRTLERSWSALWSHEEQDEAVHRADERALVARCEIEAGLRRVTVAVSEHADALAWMVQVRAFRTGARTR